MRARTRRHGKDGVDLRRAHRTCHEARGCGRGRLEDEEDRAQARGRGWVERARRLGKHRETKRHDANRENVDGRDDDEHDSAGRRGQRGKDLHGKGWMRCGVDRCKGTRERT
ncbi:hypothetical protein B0H17DRAFT_1072175 [Mycena rosella]|uniref:Uncharacterized protein n=1 Tax=Mycena rosella TaxID=1033263 RepID=A0AAD7GFH8_MYCRO|nr:hypothetical protein B0H17DRAFT_1072175 [Mycena rosella]